MYVLIIIANILLTWSQSHGHSICMYDVSSVELLVKNEPGNLFSTGISATIPCILASSRQLNKYQVGIQNIMSPPYHKLILSLNFPHMQTYSTAFTLCKYFITYLSTISRVTNAGQKSRLFFVTSFNNTCVVTCDRKIGPGEKENLTVSFTT